MPPKRKAAMKNTEKAPEEINEAEQVTEQAELPKKRGRKAAPAKPDDVAKSEEPPKRKGRPPKADKKADKVETTQEEEEPAPSPPKRGRRAKAAAPAEPEIQEKPAPAKRGRAKKTEPEEETNGETVEETKPEPAKRGRKKKSEPEEDTEQTRSEGSFHEFTANTIKGEEVSMDKYKGHVCVVVNVASKCGHTKSNYEQFVELYDKYSDSKGLRVLAFPCNQFGSQEPGDAEKICKFVEAKNVKFDLFEKINVNGKNAHPLWQWLKEQKAGPKGKDITWNFTKFIIDKEGNVVDRFQPTVKPSKLLETLEKLW